MLTYENLLHVDLAPLSEAVVKWRNLPGQFKTIARKYENTVEKGLWDYDWEGEAANAARTKLGKVKRQIDSAAEEATDIHLLLDDALHVFKSSQQKLKRLREQIEQDKYLSIKPDGEVWFDAAKPMLRWTTWPYSGRGTRSPSSPTARALGLA